MGIARSAPLGAVAEDDRSRIPYTPAQRRVMALYLADFQCAYHSTKGDQQMIIEHWDRLFAETRRSSLTGMQDKAAPTETVSRMVILFDNFYRFLFEIVPEAKPLFRSSIHVKGKALVSIVSSIKSMLQSSDIMSFASQLAQRHVRYGIKLTYFNALGLAMVRTLESCAHELWSPATEVAWRTVYAHVALIVLIALEREQRAAARREWWNQLVRRDVKPKSQNSSIPHPMSGLSMDAVCPMSGNRLSEMPSASAPRRAFETPQTIQATWLARLLRSPTRVTVIGQR